MGVPSIGADPGPLARLDAVKADELAPGVIFQRLTEGESLKDIAASWTLPKGRFVEWFTTTHADLYDAALKVRAADLALEALEFSDGQPRQVVDAAGKPMFDDAGKPIVVDPDPARDKLRVETRLKLAAKFDRARFGETVRVEKEVRVSADAGLVGAIGDLISKVRQVGQVRAPRVIESEPAVTSPAAVLAAPAAPGRI